MGGFLKESNFHKLFDPGGLRVSDPGGGWKHKQEPGGSKWTSDPGPGGGYTIDLGTGI